MEQRFTPRVLRLLLWAGHLLGLVYMLGWSVLCQFWLSPPSPDWPAEKLSAWIFGHHVNFQIGCILMVSSAALLAPWGAAIAVLTRQTESRFPVLYATQLCCIAVGTVVFVFIEIPWGVAGYRAGSVAPEITQLAWDLGWFMFLFDIFPFIVWGGAIALSILWNPAEHQLFPRWSGYFTLAICLSWTLGLVIALFHNGPFTYSGVLAMLLPFVAFFIWQVVMSILGLKAVTRLERMAMEDPEIGLHSPAWDPELHDESLHEVDELTRVPVGS